MNKKVIRRSAMYNIGGIVIFSIIFIFGVSRLCHGDLLGGIIAPVGAILIFTLFFNGVMDNKPRIIIDDEGITARELPNTKLLWADIRHVDINGLPRVGRILTFDLYDEVKYASQFSDDQHFNKKVNHLFGLSTFSIIVEGLDTSPSKIHEEIMLRINRASNHNHTE